MSPRLGLRSRILAVTMPIVVLVSAATAGIIYISIGQVLEAAARDIATAQAVELRGELASGAAADLAGARGVDGGIWVSQVVDDTGTVVMTTDAAVRTPMADPHVAVGELRVTTVSPCRGWPSGGSPWRRPTLSALTGAATPCSSRWAPGPGLPRYAVDGVRDHRRRSAWSRCSVP